MSGAENSERTPFAFARDTDVPGDESSMSGGTRMSASERQTLLRGRQANPDDPPVQRPPQGPSGPLPGPNYLGAPGRVAIVQGQVYIVGVIVVAQIFLVTTALHELLSGRTALLGWIAGASGVGFLITLVVMLWPRQRVKGT